MRAGSRLSAADSMVMHPGPMNRGLEISAEAADSARSTVLDQVANGVSVRMAVLYLLLAGERQAHSGNDEKGRRAMTAPRTPPSADSSAPRPS